MITRQTFTLVLIFLITLASAGLVISTSNYQSQASYQQDLSVSNQVSSDSIKVDIPVTNSYDTSNVCNPEFSNVQCGGEVRGTRIAVSAGPGFCECTANTTDNGCGCIIPEIEITDSELSQEALLPPTNPDPISICGVNVVDRSSGVCEGLRTGSMTTANCKCTSSCYCLGTRTGREGDTCINDESCVRPMLCITQSDNTSTCQKPNNQ